MIQPGLREGEALESMAGRSKMDNYARQDSNLQPTGSKPVTLSN